MSIFSQLSLLTNYGNSDTNSWKKWQKVVEGKGSENLLSFSILARIRESSKNDFITHKPYVYGIAKHKTVKRVK